MKKRPVAILSAALVFATLAGCGTVEGTTTPYEVTNSDETATSSETKESTNTKSITDIIPSFSDDKVYHSHNDELVIESQNKRIIYDNKHLICVDDNGNSVDLTNAAGLDQKYLLSFSVQYYNGRIYLLDNFRLVSMKLDGTDVRRMVSDIFIYDFLIHENGNMYLTGSKGGDKEYYMLRMSTKDVEDIMTKTAEGEVCQLWDSIDKLFKFEKTGHLPLNVTFVKADPDYIYYGFGDIELEPLGHYGVYRFNLSNPKSEQLLSCNKGASDPELEIKGIRVEDEELEFDDGCWVSGDDIMLFCYNRLEERFVKVVINGGNVTITPTDFNLRNSFEEVFPALFGVEFRERYHKTDKGYYCDMLGIEYYE